MAEAAAQTGDQANTHAVEVDANKLIRKNGVLGFEKSSGFEDVTNFDIAVEGYVGDGGHVIGYFLSLEINVRDPQAASEDTPVSTQCIDVYLTNRELGNHQSIVNVLNKFPALWISQSQKDPFLPTYIYNLCKDYINGDNPKKFSPVKIIGKQPNCEEWVFNTNTQMNVEGELIPKEQRKFVVIEGDMKLPQLSNVTGDFDQGEALKALLQAEKNLFQNNFPQVIMAHAVSSIVANYDLVVQEFDGCSVPVLQGQPVSGKTTAMRAVLSVFGQTKFNCESTAKFLEAKQASTTIPFGWDDADHIKTIRSIVVNSYNAGGSANTRKAYIPHTVPIITTNNDCDDIKTKSRWFRIKFEKLEPQLKGVDLEKAETSLRKAMRDAHKSIWVVTSHVYKAIKDRHDEACYHQLTEEIENVCENLKIDIRAQRMYTLMLYCAKKILEAVGLEEMYPVVLDKTLNLILPSYVSSGDCQNDFSSTSSSGRGSSNVQSLLQETLPAVVLQGQKSRVLLFFDNLYTPSSCQCGETIAVHPKMFLDYCKDSNRDTNGVTEAAIRSFVRQQRIGCTSNRIRFRGSKVQVSAVHISRAWFQEDVLKKLDECFGLRNKKSKKGSSAAGTDEVTSQADQGSSAEGTDKVTSQVHQAENTEGMDVELNTVGQAAETDGMTSQADQGSPLAENIEVMDIELNTVGQGPSTAENSEVLQIDSDIHLTAAGQGRPHETGTEVQTGKEIEDRLLLQAAEEAESSNKDMPKKAKKCTSHRRKGTKDEASSLKDRLHPGEIKGKRPRRGPKN